MPLKKTSDVEKYILMPIIFTIAAANFSVLPPLQQNSKKQSKVFFRLANLNSYRRCLRHFSGKLLLITFLGGYYFFVFQCGTADL